MEKKEFLKGSPLPRGFPPFKEGFDFRPQIPGFSSKVFGVVKLILGVLILPFVYSASISFLNEFNVIDGILQRYFWSGAISFLIIYLFIWEPTKIYSRGQKILEAIFRFFAPLVKIAPYLLPIYFILIFVTYLILSFTVKSEGLINYSIFLFGFTLALHLVFSAKSIRSKQGGFLTKANYVFGFSLIYIINLILLSFCLNIIFNKFSFVNFANYSFQIAKGIFSAVFKQIF